MTRRLDAQTLFLNGTLLLALIGGIYVSIETWRGPRAATIAADASETAEVLDTDTHTTSAALEAMPLDPERCREYLEAICALGPRFSGSPGMHRQQELLEKHFQAAGGQVRRQTFRVRHPLDGSPVEMTNLVVEFYPERTERVMLCAHYDTRPFPDRDPDPARRQGEFLGANDGGSGVAVLMELARFMKSVPAPLGVDFVLFDGEELIYDDERDRDRYFLGSVYFARQYAQNPPSHRYRCAVLLDMVGDQHLQIYQERTSLSWPDSRPLVQSIWQTAKRLRVREFIDRPRHEIRDDHLPLHDLGGIPACDIIDFDYGIPGQRGSFWHTSQDIPAHCSGESLAKVGWVVLEWLQQGARFR